MQRKAVVMMLALAAVSLAVAQETGPPPPRWPGGDQSPPHTPRERCLTAFLVLTDDQAAAWAVLRDQLHDAVMPLEDRRRALGEQIRTELEGGAPDPARVGELMIQAHAVGGEILAAGQAHERAFRALLDADQLARYGVFVELQETCPGPDGPMGHGAGPFPPGPRPE
jgi:hypothetical protein